MNLWIRLLKTVLLLVLKPRRIDISGESRLYFRVWPNDLDTNLHMNNGRYLTLMDLGRFDFVARCGLGIPTLRRRWFPVLGSLSIRFRRSLRPWQPFELRTRLLGWDTRWIFMEQDLHSEGQLVARALLKGVFLHKGQPVANEKVLALGGFRRESPELPDHVKRICEGEEAMMG